MKFTIARSFVKFVNYSDRNVMMMSICFAFLDASQPVAKLSHMHIHFSRQHLASSPASIFQTSPPVYNVHRVGPRRELGSLNHLFVRLGAPELHGDDWSSPGGSCSFLAGSLRTVA